MKIPRPLNDKLQVGLEYNSHKAAYQWLEKRQKIFSDVSIGLRYEILMAIYGNIRTSFSSNFF
jgi:hypothetical protein